MKENSILWWRVTEAKFGMVDRSWYSRVLIKLHWMGCKKIFMESYKFQECIRWIVGNGERTSSETNPWLGEGALRDRFLQMFAIARYKDISVRY